LALPQLAMIAGLPKAPSRYNPITNPARALIRRNWILKRMLRLGSIDQETYQQAKEALVIAEYHGLRPEVEASYLAEMTRKEMLDRYGKQAYTHGYSVVTTVHSDLQIYANNAVQDGLQSYDQRHGYRGPEANITPSEEPLTANETITDELTTLELATNPTEEWQAALKKYRVIGPLIPGIVTSLEDHTATVFLKKTSFKNYNVDEQGEITLTLKNIEWARPFITVNKKGLKPKIMSDTLTVGDVIRVISKPNKKPKKIANTDTGDITSNNNNNTHWVLGQLPAAQAALVSLSPQNGAIQAIVGGFDFHQSKFNRAIQAGRQAGSNFKPFIYTAALANGYTAASIINDAPVVFNDKSLESTWRPENSSGKFFGPTRLRKALYKSRNLVSIRLLRKTGIRNTIDYASRFGFDPDALPKDLSLALGSAAVTPLEVATGYTAFANGGYKVSPYFIQTISDSDNKTIYKATPDFVCDGCAMENESSDAKETLEIDLAQSTASSIELTDKDLEEQALQATEDLFLLDSGLLEEKEEKPNYAERIVEPRVIYIVNSILKDVIKKGTGRRARVLNRNDIAGKTGTTNDQKDAWFSGFNQDLVTTTWLGFDTPKTLGAREYGGTAALPIWIKFMGKALKGKPQREFKQPERLITLKIDPSSGERALPGQSDAIFEIFREEYAPKKLTTNTNSVLTSSSQQEESSTIEELF